MLSGLAGLNETICYSMECVRLWPSKRACTQVIKWRTLEGLKFELIRSHPLVGIYFVNKGTNIASFEMMPAKTYFVKNILSFFIFFTALD